MKKAIIFFLLCNSILLKAQVSHLSAIKFVRVDSTKQVTLAGDTSYIFNAIVLTHTIGGITGFSLTCKTYSASSANWIVKKDTSYSWSSVSTLQNTTQIYSVAKPNNNIVKVCIGRLERGTRQRFIFKIAGSNGLLTKEFNY